LRVAEHACTSDLAFEKTGRRKQLKYESFEHTGGMYIVGVPAEKPLNYEDTAA